MRVLCREFLDQLSSMSVVKMRNDENVKLIKLKNKYSHFSYSSDIFTKIPKLGEFYFINSA